MNQSEFLDITCKLLKAREKSRAKGAIAVALVLLLICAKLMPKYQVYKLRLRSHNCFHSHLKTALYGYAYSHEVAFIISSDGGVFK